MRRTTHPMEGAPMSDETRHACRIEAVEAVTHDVRRLVVARPAGYGFEPGQATEVAIDRDGLRDEKRPFTFTSLPSDPRLEFTIKIYPEHDGVTARIGELGVGDGLEIGEAWGTIRYRGPGVFIAGGAGVTPFIAILRRLQKTDDLPGNRLLLSNKTAADVILAGEFRRMLGERAVFTLTREQRRHYEHGRIDRTFIRNHVDDFTQPFYVCGPPPMVDDVTACLRELGADSDAIVVEA